MAMRMLMAAVGLSITAGCVHMNPPPTPGCALTAYPLRVDAGGARLAGDDFEGVVRASMSAPASAGPGLTPAMRPSVLILSGGSQHGAFGAGFFAGMTAVPEYKLVTGVSTGALQSTFLFLANRPAPADRIYPAYFPAGAGIPTPATPRWPTQSTTKATSSMSAATAPSVASCAGRSPSSVRCGASSRA